MEVSRTPNTSIGKCAPRRVTYLSLFGYRQYGDENEISDEREGIEPKM